ncbi:hypothetical protein AB6A40_008167 [Gnathostoma spinigerum]|uniref:SOCS box domain-containing protein n=1 Tax=Gnathostoma spinigerum TaxID=75299 RepID=A0ABD6ENB7_9BILA
MESDSEASVSQYSENENSRKRSYKTNVPFLYSEGTDHDHILDARIKEEIHSLAGKSVINDMADYSRLVHSVTVGVACRLGRPELTRLLLLNGEGTFPDDRNWFPLHEAAYGLHYDCCDILFKIGHVDPNAQAHDGVTPLLLVCRSDHGHDTSIMIARLLLENGADPNLCSLDEMTPLIQAIKSRNEDLVKLLLESGADPHKNWYNDWTPLHEAANSHNEKIMQWLLDRHLSPFAVDHVGYNALHVAVQEGYLPCVELLLKAAGDNAADLANARLKDDASCVMLAASEGFDKILKILIEYGADCNLLFRPIWSDDPGGGIHALAAAAQRDYWRCVELLVPHVDRGIVARSELDPLSAAAYRGSENCVKIMLDEGFSTEVFTRAPESTIIVPFLIPIFQRSYHTPLREAVRKGHTRVVEMLIEAGATMTYGRDAHSPFLFAFRNRLDPMIARCFLEHNVDLNLRSDGTLTNVPDAALAILGTQNRTSLFKLLKCGLDPALKYWCGCSNENGYSLLYDVQQSPYISDVSELLKLLSVFSPSIPNCCNKIAEIIECEPKVASLAHLCRLSARSCVRPSELLDNRWLKHLHLPLFIKDYLAFKPMPLKFEHYE